MCVTGLLVGVEVCVIMCWHDGQIWNGEQDSQEGPCGTVEIAMSVVGAPSGWASNCCLIVRDLNNTGKDWAKMFEKTEFVCGLTTDSVFCRKGRPAIVLTPMSSDSAATKVACTPFKM